MPTQDVSMKQSRLPGKLCLWRNPTTTQLSPRNLPRVSRSMRRGSLFDPTHRDQRCATNEQTGVRQTTICCLLRTDEIDSLSGMPLDLTSDDYFMSEGLPLAPAASPTLPTPCST